VRYSIRFGSNGGFSKPVNEQLFSGNPALGENYRHELVHVVALPLASHGTTLLASEGLATWLGGTEGVDYRGSVRTLARYLAAHPAVTLDSAMYSPSTPRGVRYATGAVLCSMLADAGGVPAVERFVEDQSSDARPLLSQLLGRPWSVVSADWRRLTALVADSGSRP